MPRRDSVSAAIIQGNHTTGADQLPHPLDGPAPD